MTTVSQGSSPEATTEERSILPCDFRSAGRLSNESVRQLRTMHDVFARSVAHALDLFLGFPMGVKMSGVEQIAAREFVTRVALGSYLAPFNLMPMQSRVVLKFDSALLFPLLDVLLGGTGEPMEQLRELTDIDEELIRSVVELIGAQLERVWKPCNVSVLATPSLRPAALSQAFALEERLILLHFELTLGSTTAAMSLVLPMAFCNALVRSSQMETTRRLGQEIAGQQRLRERLLECDMVLSAELAIGRITVGELLHLQAGTVLNLRTPVQTPVRLGVGEYPLFEVTPVRRAGRKTAQLNRAYQPAKVLSGVNA